ncbi:diheme cytochrome c [Ideonella dechloratans]|uniref:diheme cytochrome c n=1 Tax=Ideonella dechloratans TaxID=36863 RepID=UPI0035B48896
MNTPILSLMAALALLAGPLHAEEEEHGERGRSARVPVLPQYQAECSACHVAFPAGGLPAASWARLMQNLPQHFGTDASLDPATTRQISQWLQANAASGRRAQDTPPEDRITRTQWFVREHHEISSTTWQRAAIGKPSNCAACHTGAPQGRFSEHDVRIPR